MKKINLKKMLNDADYEEFLGEFKEFINVKDFFDSDLKILRDEIHLNNFLIMKK